MTADTSDVVGKKGPDSFNKPRKIEIGTIYE